MDDDRLRRTALDQHGLVTRRQVLAAGGTDAIIGHRVRNGQWGRSRRGVLVVGAAPPTWEQRVMAAVLAAGPDHLGSDRTAARIWTVVPRSGRIQLLCGGPRPATLDGVSTRSTELLPEADRAVVDHIPVTSIARTIVDLSVRQDPAVVGAWVDDAVRRLGLAASRTGGLGRIARCGHKSPPTSDMYSGHVAQGVRRRAARSTGYANSSPLGTTSPRPHRAEPGYLAEKVGAPGRLEQRWPRGGRTVLEDRQAASPPETGRRTAFAEVVREAASAA